MRAIILLVFATVLFGCAFGTPEQIERARQIADFRKADPGPEFRREAADRIIEEANSRAWVRGRQVSSVAGTLNKLQESVDGALLMPQKDYQIEEASLSGEGASKSELMSGWYCVYMEGETWRNVFHGDGLKPNNTAIVHTEISDSNGVLTRRIRRVELLNAGARCYEGTPTDGFPLPELIGRTFRYTPCKGASPNNHYQCTG